MTDREKVIKGLEEVQHYIKVENLPAHTLKAKLVIDDALALLKVQEPRVMTSAEVEAWLMIGRVDRTPIVIEVRDRFIAWVVGDEYYDLPECDLSGEFYNKTWRCWTSRPDQATREAVKWDGTD